MRKLKEIQSSLATILTIVFLIPTFISCSDVNGELKLEEAKIAKYKKIEDKYRGQALKMLSDLKIIKKQFESLQELQMQSKNSNETEVTQEILDNYALSLGFEAGVVTLELFNTVMTNYEDLVNNDFEYVIDNQELDGFTKDKIKAIAESHSHLDDLYSSEFNNLSNPEQEQLIYLNTLAEDANTLSLQQQSEFWDGFTAGSVGFISGALGCAALCGPCGIGCGVAGFFIGIFVLALNPFNK